MTGYGNQTNFGFDVFRLDTARRRLSRAETGELIRIVPKAIELLIVLLQNRERFVSKDELLETVWNGSIVEESNLSQTIFVLRKALGDNSKEPRLILTLPNQGYKFIGQVQPVDSGRAAIDSGNGSRFERRGTSNASAYRAYVRGRFFWNKRTGDSLKAAVAHFENAVAEDPQFVQAYAGLADCHRLLAEYYSASVPKEARDAVVQAIVIDEKLAEGHASLGYAQAFYEWDWEAAEQSFKKALELNPNHARALQMYAELLCVTGRFSEARVRLEHALEIEPDSTVIQNGLAVYFYLLRQPDELIAQAKKLIQLDPDFAYGHFYLGFGYELKGLYPEAVDTFAKAAVLFGEPQECADEMLDAFRKSGMTGVWNTRLEQYATRPHLKDYPPYLKSLVPVRIGDIETSIKWLNQAYEQRDRGVIYARYEPFLEPLREDPRFLDLLQKIGL